MPTKRLTSASWRIAAAVSSLALLLAVSCGGPESQDQLEVADGSYAAVLRLAKQDFRSAEEIIQQCMVEQGFDYHPRQPEAVGLGRLLVEDVTVEEYVAEYGWGLTTLEFAVPQAIAPDPVVESLTPAERIAYDMALNGDGTPDGAQGCAPAAFTQAEAGEAADLSARHNSAVRIFNADPEKFEFDLVWSECMARHGFTFESPERVRLYLQERGSNLIVELADSVEPGPNNHDDAQASPLWQELVQEELALAASSLECGVQPPHLGPPEALADTWARALEQAGN